MELISVIIPVYNTEKYLKKCVDSFIAQTYKNIEILLIDDGSTDSSPQICDSYKKQDPRVKVIHKKNGGLSDARNAGIDASCGELVTFYDSDDYVDLDYIEYLYDLKVKYNAEISSCGYNIVDENGKILFAIGNNYEKTISREMFLKKMLVEDEVTVSACFKLYDKTLFNSVRFPVGKICEDNGTTYKVIDNVTRNIAFGGKAKCYYVMRKNSIMRSSFSLRKLDMIEMTDKMCDYLDSKYPEMNEYTLRRRVYARFNVLRQINYKDKSTKNIMYEMVRYILKRRKMIIRSKIVPKRDKIACLLLRINVRLFFVCWAIYRKIKYV